MKCLLSFIFGVLFTVGVIEPYYINPATNIPVTVTVGQGDTLGEIILRLKKEYNDRRDWREIAYYATKANRLGQWLQPGQVIVFEMEAR